MYGGGDRTRTCTPLPTNGFLDRGSTNYAYSSKYATLTGGRKPLALNARFRKMVRPSRNISYSWHMTSLSA